MVKKRVVPPKGRRSTIPSQKGPSGLAIIFFSLMVVVFLYSTLRRNHKEPSLPVTAVTRVQVLNGCGVDGLAARVAKLLRRQGYDVVDVGNTPLLLESLIVDRVGNRDAARRLAEILGVEERNIIQQRCDYLELDLTVILGKDYKELKIIEVGGR